MAIVFRGPPYLSGSPTSQPWGAGQGSNLTPDQVDDNFYYMLTLIQDLQTTQGAGISYFVINGNLMYVHLTNHQVLGPYVLPMWTPVPVGEWEPDTQYYSNNVVWYNGATYLVIFNHISPPVFDPFYEVGGNTCYSPPILVCPGDVLPIGGEPGEVLTVVHAGGSGIPAIAWDYLLPSGGTAGDVLALVTPGTSFTPAITGWAASAGSLAFGARLVGGADGDILFDAAGTLEGATLGALIDIYLGDIQGSILYRNSTQWATLLPGVSGYFLETLGNGQNPMWAPAPGSGGGGADLIIGHSPVIGAPSETLLTSGTGELDYLNIGSGLEIVGNSLQTSGAGGTGLSTVTTITAAELHIINSSPVTLVAAPGAHLWVSVTWVRLTFFPGSYPFYGEDSLSIYYACDLDNDVISPSGFLIGATESRMFSGSGYYFGVSTIGSLADQPLILQPPGNYDAGPILTASVGAGGSGYNIGDTGTLTTSSGDATYQVTGVGGGGAVTTFIITNPGEYYYVGPSTTLPITGGGDGSFIISVDSVQVGDGTLIVTIQYNLIDSTTGEVVG